MPDVRAETLLTDRDVAEMLQSTPWLVWRLQKDGELRSVKVGRLRRYRYADVMEFIERNSEGGSEPRPA